MEGKFVYSVSSKEIPVGIGGKNFEMKVYDCTQKKFFDVLSIECDGRTVKVRPLEWCEDIFIYG